MKRADVIVVGGGIAGLSAARAALHAGAGHVLLLEREGAPCAHSSGRNAAIFRHLSTTPGDLDLALQSRALLDELLGSDEAWLRRTGTWFVSPGGDPDPIASLASLAASRGLPHRRAQGDDLHATVPSLQGGPMRSGLFSPDDGVIDIHAVTQALVRAIGAAGGELRFGVEVAAVEADRGRVTGVRLASGDRVAAASVVLAGGAWAGALGATCGAPLPLTPRRRHLAQIETPVSRADPGRPVVWCFGDELYYRPESSGLLVSPCDGDPWPAELPPPSQAGLELLARKLARTVPRLADASVRRAWACLRTFAPDGAAVVGADPRLAGLHWIAGLGGHGMTGGLAAGELLAAVLTGHDHPLKSTLAISPGRALGGDGSVREKPREVRTPAA
jgi:glycine/D-amino acid oxidase-like deaminating enzyme